MLLKKIVQYVIMVMLLFLFTSHDLFAQRAINQDKKQSSSVFQLYRNSDQNGMVMSLNKMKSAADNGIVQSLTQYNDQRNWVDNYRANYEYSTDRLTITMNMEVYDQGTSTWSEAGNTTMVLNEAGFPASSTSVIFGDSNEQHFYYSNTNPLQIDSVIFSQISNGGEFREKYEFNYITQDSIRLIITTTENSVTVTNNNNYMVNRDGNFIEVYDEGLYLDRYINSGVSMSDFLENIFNEFFFIEIYNDELYNGDTEYTPYSRTTLAMNGQVVTGTMYEYYYDSELSWIAQNRDTYTYESGKLVMEEEEYSSDGTNWILDYRTFYSYSGAVSNELEDETVANFKLAQNYPNPFNPTTQIIYTIPKTEQVVLEVFNVLGNRIATLVRAPQYAGTYTVTFDARNYPSGIYFYKLNSGDMVEVHSMTLIK